MTNGLTHDALPSQRDDDHDMDGSAPDADDLAPVCDEQEFTAIVHSMVTDEAPRLFAVVQEYGERADGWIAAWGMAFADHAEVVSVERRDRMSLPAPENALRTFRSGNHIRARLVWFDGEAGARGA
ncbi:MAG TPA: hypothetical protein VGI74_27520 [Streptosporangiaceae bacterium]|jgi:hypothetical protein